MNHRLTALCAVLALSGRALAQLPPPPVPANNPLTPEKVLLGKAIFWDEQLSSTGTVSCGTCHMPEAGGSDPRTRLDPEASLHPGADGLLRTADDVHGSPGVPAHDVSGAYQRDPLYGFHRQVTGRKAPTVIGAAYSRHLFWDGRAEETTVDPETGQPLPSPLAALETQVLGPPVSSVEMGFGGRTWSDVTARLAAVAPLALSDTIPEPLASFVAGRSYPELFTLAFGSPEVTAPRIAMAVASYERTLIPDHTPWDSVLAGQFVDQVLTPEEHLGLQFFLDPSRGDCLTCHGRPPSMIHFGDDRFHYIGVRPATEDPGRFAVTGRPQDLGAMRTPRLRNVELRAPYMRDGRFNTLEEVVEFYNRGGDFDAPNKHPSIRQLNLDPSGVAAIVAFLRRPLTDPRVAAALPPFDRPSQYADSTHVPQLLGTGTPGSGGLVPELIAIEPPKVGAGHLTVALDGALGGAPAFLLLSASHDPLGVPRFGALVYPTLAGSTFVSVPALQGQGPGDGWTSAVLPVPSAPTAIGTQLYAQWFVLDPGAQGRFSASRAVGLTWY
ncbi:MAG: hypothetical protein H6828_13935 [Planctomycetes bacterium]|nr:hypothetical protein [Planctomycetota bacterium]